MKEFVKLGKTLQNDSLKQWKASGGKVMGYYCSNVPRELLHAAGFLPYRIRGIENDNLIQADTVMSRFNCTFVRSTLNLAMNGKYDFLEGLLVLNSCDHIRRMFDIWKRKVDSVKNNNTQLLFMSYPHLFSAEGWNWMREEIELFQKTLQDKFKVQITEEQIKAAFDIYDENIQLMLQIDEFRYAESPKITGTQFFELAIANEAVRKDFANQELKKIIQKLNTKEPLPKNRARLMLIGSSSDNSDFIRILEHNGAIIVADTLCTGTYANSNKDVWDFKKLKTHGDITDKLVERAYGKIFCPRMMDGYAERLNIIKQEIKTKQIDGVVLQRIEFCDMHGCENMLFQHELEDELGFPVLSLDREYFLGDTGRLRTRIEAFLEKIGR